MDVSRAILAGIVGTAIMTAFMMLAPLMGMPEMNPPQMMAGLMGVSVIVGWIMHFMIGIVFALIYAGVLASMLPIANIWIKGLVFGIIAFVMGQVGMMIMQNIFDAPGPGDSMVPMMIASLVGHIVFGIAVVRTYGR